MDSVRGRENLQDSVTKVGFTQCEGARESTRFSDKVGITQCEGARESTRYSDKVGITHWVTLRQVNHLWSTRENTRD